MKEEWRDIAGYEGRYQVSDLGRVKSIISYNGYKPGRILTPILQSKSGHARLTVILSSGNRKVRPFCIHRLVWGAFVGPLIPHSHLRFKDGNYRNCRLDNLTLGYDKTAARQILRLEKFGRPGAYKLTAAAREEIKTAPPEVSSTSLAKKHGVSLSMVSRVRNGWR